jgi:hypothetical protein
MMFASGFTSGPAGSFTTGTSTAAARSSTTTLRSRGG